MPKKLLNHQMVPFDKDVVIIGGGGAGTVKSSLYRFTCQNQDCEWKSMSQKLKLARYLFVAMLIPDELVDCGKYIYFIDAHCTISTFTCNYR